MGLARDGVSYGWACIPSTPCVRSLTKNCTQHDMGIETW